MTGRSTQGDRLNTYFFTLEDTLPTGKFMGKLRARNVPRTHDVEGFCRLSCGMLGFNLKSGMPSLICTDIGCRMYWNFPFSGAIFSDTITESLSLSYQTCC